MEFAKKIAVKLFVRLSDSSSLELVTRSIAISHKFIFPGSHPHLTLDRSPLIVCAKAAMQVRRCIGFVVSTLNTCDPLHRTLLRKQL